MGRILLAWELGANYGHISMLLPIARRLRQLGHAILFAVKDGPARQLLDGEGFKFVLSPRASARNNRSPKPASFADILAGAGFANVETLTGLITAWHDLFNHFQPTVLVAQYAPVALFAARLLDLPCLQINTGFESPPQMAPFPCFRPYLKLTNEQLLARDLAILESINAVNVRYGSAANGSLQEALKSDLDLLATLPELDHYPGRKSGQYIGPVADVNDGIAVQWPDKTGPRIFAYLRPIPGIASILSTLRRSSGCVIAVIPGIDDKLILQFEDKRLRLTRSLIKLSDILPEIDLAMTHANHGTTATALLAGVPMLVIPTTVEQWLLTRKIERLGLGIGIERAKIAVQFPDAFLKLQSDPQYHEQARRLAEKYAGYDQMKMLQRLIKTIENLPEWIARQRKTEPQGQMLEKNFVSS